MRIKEVTFVGSYDRVDGCPKGSKPEFAFIGRSNVGKSSLINMLTARKELARVSKEPGKTQLINYFLVDHSWHLVDLPGYGYAKISKKKRLQWQNMISGYLTRRKNLINSFVLLDSRHPLQAIDLEFINWLGEERLPFSIIYTKVDKLKSSRMKRNIRQIESELLKYWNTLPQSFISSAVTRHGKDEILEYIGMLVEEYRNSLAQN